MMALNLNIFLFLLNQLNKEQIKYMFILGDIQIQEESTPRS